MRSKSLYAVFMNYWGETILKAQLLARQSFSHTVHRTPNINRPKFILHEWDSKVILVNVKCFRYSYKNDDRFCHIWEQGAYRRLTVADSKRDFTFFVFIFFFMFANIKIGSFASFWWLQRIHNAHNRNLWIHRSILFWLSRFKIIALHTYQIERIQFVCTLLL